MRIIRALCLVLAGATAFAAQNFNTTLQQSNLPPSDFCTVEGIVVKSTNGQGIKRVTVQLNPLNPGSQPYSTQTENTGRFVIHGIAPGRYAIFASGEGFSEEAQQKGKRSTQSSVLELTPGKTVTGIAFRLVPPGVITGTIYDEDGDPVVRAQVRAMRVAGYGSHRQMGGGGSAMTNDLGEYRIWGLPAGKYIVAATYAPPQNNIGKQSDEVYLPSFHPGTPDTSQAALVEVEAGNEATSVDVDLMEAHSVAIRGRVVLESPIKSLRGVYLSLIPRTSDLNTWLSNYGGSVQDDVGDFEIRNVPPGPYNLISSWGDGRRQLAARVPIDVTNSNIDGLTVVLASPFTLAGRFRIEGGNKFEYTRLGLVLQPVDNGMGAGNAEVKPDGTFIIRNVNDGTYHVRVFGFPEEYYVKSVQEGGSEVLASGLTITHSQPPSSLEIGLSSDGGRVDGSVLRGQNPVPGSWVVLAPDPPFREREEMFSMKAADGTGRFSLLGLPPGNFKIFAWEPVDGTNYSDPDLLEAFENRGTPVHISEREQQTVQVELITAEEQLR